MSGPFITNLKDRRKPMLTINCNGSYKHTLIQLLDLCTVCDMQTIRRRTRNRNHVVLRYCYVIIEDSRRVGSKYEAGTNLEQQSRSVKKESRAGGRVAVCGAWLSVCWRRGGRARRARRGGHAGPRRARGRQGRARQARQAGTAHQHPHGTRSSCRSTRLQSRCSDLVFVLRVTRSDSRSCRPLSPFLNSFSPVISVCACRTLHVAYASLVRVNHWYKWRLFES